jgi:signal transduction histidine kinase/phage shock protein PspC (stress-responsive transcriptional regulator)
MTTTESNAVGAASLNDPEGAGSERASADPTTAAESTATGATESSPGPGSHVPPVAESPVRRPDEPSNGRGKATRVAEGAMLGGVATGLAKHLGWPVMVIRVGFVVLMMFQFLGALVYGALWLLLPPETTTAAPGLAAADRANMRDPSKPKRRMDWGMLIALAALGTGLLWLARVNNMGISQQIFWPVVFACAGAALVWRQADSARQKQWKSEAGGRVWLAPFVASGGWPALVRIVLGLALVGAAFGIVLAQRGLLGQLPQVAAMTTLALAGLAIVVAPWVYRSRSALSEARSAKVRADARADMAAHLHDSVLQTLALMQRHADDPKVVQQLARRQERELRTWLYGDELAELTLKAALTEAAAEVEDERGIPVEIIVVGDAETSDSVQALVRAAREAMVNAAKHSGADKIDVYAEVDEDTIEVFVRDRGVGFDPDAVSEDRMGVRGSILDRMARHGGTAQIRSTPGNGAEVRLEIRR